eukprot:7545474-Pyramimonas_sp.AAC.1
MDTYSLFAHMFETSYNGWKNRTATPDGIIIYTDDATTGNPLAPDPKTKVVMVYWTCAWWPEWFRSRSC